MEKPPEEPGYEPPRRRVRPFIVEVNTTEGKVSERFATYEQAQDRIARFPPETLAGTPMLFQELPDGSFRAVRLDGKPLQLHRIEDEPVEGEPLPLTDQEPTGKEIKFREAGDGDF